MKNTARCHTFLFCPLPTDIKHRTRWLYRGKAPFGIPGCKVKQLIARPYSNTENSCPVRELSKQRPEKQM